MTWAYYAVLFVLFCPRANGTIQAVGDLDYWPIRIALMILTRGLTLGSRGGIYYRFCIVRLIHGCVSMGCRRWVWLSICLVMAVYLP
jgi:hypothetical protein